MGNVLIEENDLYDIADSIRAKLGVTDTYKPSEMADAIDDIGGSSPTGTINITTNGTHDVTQYASAAVAVPNSYSASDEGKVVSNGALVSQSSDTCTENGTVDTTLINSLVVNVSGGSSVLSGSFTPDSDVNTYTISALAGTTLNHFLMFGLPADVIGHSKREIGLGYVDYDKNIFYSSASNSSGSAIGTAGGATIASGNVFRFDRTTGAINTSTGSNGGGYLIGGVTYYWFAW